MDKIFIGLIFIFFNLNLSFNFVLTISVNFLPDFIGYILIYLGIKKLKIDSKNFKDIIPYTIILIVLSTTIPILNFFIISINESILLSLDIVITLMLIYVLYRIICGIEDIEKKEERNFDTNLLHSTWRIFCIIVLIDSLIVFLLDIDEKILLVGTILSISTMIIFVLVFNRSRKLYNSYH